MFKKILCPIDGSSPARKALTVALDMAKRCDAELVVMHTMLRKGDFSAYQNFAQVEGLAERIRPELRRLQMMDSRLDVGAAYDDQAISSRTLVELGQRILDDAKIHAKQQGLKDVELVLADGDPADQIIDYEKDHGVDCVIMGSRGLSDIKAMFLGSVSHKVANRVSCTCISVK